MKFTWSPERGLLGGAFVFLSASVPDPKRHRRFLEGPEDTGLMLRVIDRRVDDAVQSLLAQTLNAGGRIVHGGHPKIMMPIAHQANQWKIPDGIEAPIRIYQSEFFRGFRPPLGRDELEKTGAGVVRWVSADLWAVAARYGITADWIERQLPLQAPPEAPAAMREALLAMRIEMIIDSQPTSAVCIGGMEGIEAEARIYLDLAKMGLIRAAEHVHVLGSTYGAAAQLQGEGIVFADQVFFGAQKTGNVSEQSHGTHVASIISGRSVEESATYARPQLKAAFTSTQETARHDLQNRVSYDAVMRSLVKTLAPAGR